MSEFLENQWQRNRAAVIGLAILLVALLLFGLYLLVDNIGLSQQEGVAVVLKKEIWEQADDPAPLLQKDQVLPEPLGHPRQHILHLRLAGRELQIAVDNDVYERIRLGNRLNAQYEKARLSGAVTLLGLHTP